MRTKPPAPGKRVSDWIGLKVRATTEIKTGVMSVPAGTVFTVLYGRSGLTLKSDPCGHCGASMYCRSVPTTFVEILPQQEPEREGCKYIPAAEVAALARNIHCDYAN